jgi:hypothetical protein
MVEDAGMEVTVVDACSMNMEVRVARRIRRELLKGRLPTLSMATVCSGLAMFARTTTVAVIVTQISVQIVAPAMAVVILEEILGATTTGDSRILAMEEGMTQTVVLIIAVVYQLENNNWLKRQQKLWRDNLLIDLARESLCIHLEFLLNQQFMPLIQILCLDRLLCQRVFQMELFLQTLVKCNRTEIWSSIQWMHPSWKRTLMNREEGWPRMGVLMLVVLLKQRRRVVQLVIAVRSQAIVSMIALLLCVTVVRKLDMLLLIVHF